MPVGETLLTALREALGAPPARLGVAVSGGGDSLALLHLLADWRAAGGPALSAATVDHGLRPEAAAEASHVALICAGLGIPHATLRWQEGPQGNLMAAARAARYRLLCGWAAAEGLKEVALGHTGDDQAETFLMRLARGSGVDGLAGMAGRREIGGIAFLRPLLAIPRQALRGYLGERGIGWAEDPTNADTAYDRTRARQALAALAPLGLTAETLSATAGWMARAREVLDDAARDLAARIARIEAGDVILDRAGLAAAREETRLRLVAGALRWISSAPYRPRLAALRAVLEGPGPAGRRTLHGCLLTEGRGTLRIGREFRAAAGASAAPGALWDGRWRVTGPFAAGDRIAALGTEGLRACPDWRATGLPRATLLASPAVWRGATLLAAPFAAPQAGWQAEAPADGTLLAEAAGVRRSGH